jgi:hypothetical protein
VDPATGGEVNDKAYAEYRIIMEEAMNLKKDREDMGEE